MTIIFELVLLAVLLALSAFFSSAETALFSLNPIQVHRIKQVHPVIARQLSRMLSRPARLLSTILVGNTLVNVAASVVGLVIAEVLMTRYAEPVSVAVMTVLLLICGEVTPKRFAMMRPESLAVFYVPVLVWVIRILTPIRLLLDWIAGVFKGSLTPHGRILSEDEFRTLISISSEEGVLSEDEKEMVDGIIRLEEIRAADAMTPRVDLAGLDLNDEPSVLVSAIRRTLFRFLVVYREHLDQIEGLLDVRKYLLDPAHDLMNAVIPPVFVPESARLNTILKDFQRDGRRIAVVVDEYGGIAGVLTRGDILEEVIDVGDENGNSEDDDIRQVSENLWVVDGSTSLDDVNRELEIELESEDADRIAGWVIDNTRHLPRIGEVVYFEGGRVTVKEIRKKRITKLDIELMREQEED